MLHSIFDSAIDVDCSAGVLNHVRGSRSEFVRLGIQDIDLISASEISIWSLNDLACCGAALMATAVVVAHDGFSTN